MSDANVFNTAPGEASWEMLDSRNMAKSRALKSMLFNVCHTCTVCPDGFRYSCAEDERFKRGRSDRHSLPNQFIVLGSQYREDYQRDPFYAVVGRYSSGTRSVEATTDGYGNKCLRVCLCPIPY
jgi:hypothetical protein